MKHHKNGNGDPLKSCDTCRIVWHKATLLVEPYKKGGYSYYQDFPHYGLEKQTCPRCKRKEIKDVKYA